MAASNQGYDVFLCHAGENKAFVRQLVDRLEKDGLKKERIFYDEISLQPGDKLDSILKVIESPSLKLFVFVVSKYCFKSNKAWIRTEWETALENNKQIFPIWLDENDDGFKAFGNLVKDFSYKLKTIIAQRVNPQEISSILDGLSEKICSLVFGDQQTQQRPQPPSNVGPSSARQNFLPDVLPAKLKLEFVQKSLSKLLDKAEALFDDDTLKNEDRLEEADKIFDRFKARIVSIIPQGCFIINLRFFQPDNVDEFYHDHFRLGPDSLSAALTSLLVTDEMRAAAGGEELMVRIEVRYDDYIRVRRQLCMTGILKTSSVDDLPTLVGPGTERRIRSADLESLDLAIAITEDSRFTEWVSHPGTRHLAKKARQVTALERRLEIGKHQGEIQEDILRSLQREVTRLNAKDEEAQKVLMTKTEEVNELQKTNKVLEAKIEAIMVAKPKIPIISPDEDDASRGARDEEAQRALMRKTQEINHLHETIRGLEATIEAMEAAKTKTDTPSPGKDDTSRGAEGGARPKKRDRKIFKKGRDVTEEILGGRRGSGRSNPTPPDSGKSSATATPSQPIRILQRYSAPPTVTSTPPQTFAVPQQAYPQLQAPTWAHIVAGRTPTQGEQHVYRPSEGPQWDPGVRGTDPAPHEVRHRAKRTDELRSTESYLGDLVPWPLTMDWIQGELERLLTEEWEDNHSIFDWIEENVSKRKTKHVTFIRALMTAVARSAIVDEGTGQELCDTDSVQKRVVLLQIYLDNESTKELQALFALQALMVELDHPPNLLETFFDVLYDENVISKYAFYAWESNTDPAEQEGKRVALKSVTAFFTRLREEEERR
ncbi:2'-5'-oligoadenylate synthetase [Branchiostoma belcheri]|nr:2'-5'-oligoadenylate synthetase [Branchiostoma belcheri]